MVKKPIYLKEVFQKCEIQPIEPNDDMSLKVYSDIITNLRCSWTTA